MTDLADRLHAARDLALRSGVPARRKDSELYRLLADCLAICELVERDGLKERLREEIAVSVNIRNQSNKGKGRRYVELGSDIPVTVCRFVLDGVDNRSSVYRYATCLREAAKRQIRSDALVDWVQKNGGLVTLYQGRKRGVTQFQVKTLHLNSRVNVPKDGMVTLTLRRDMRGFFDVVSHNAIPRATS